MKVARSLRHGRRFWSRSSSDAPSVPFVARIPEERPMGGSLNYSGPLRDRVGSPTWPSFVLSLDITGR